jgi:dCTP deaminase
MMGLLALSTERNVTTPSVVTNSRDFSREKANILIQDGDSTQLTEISDECNSGYDLRVGRVFRDHRNEYGQELGDDDEIPLLPGHAVIIQTAEWVHFSDQVFGTIFPKVSLVQKGIANIPTKVDPGFKGHLLITVFNYGKRNETLRYKQRFCSIHIFNVLGDVRPYESPPPSIGARRLGRWYQKFADWIDRHGTRISVIAAVVSAAAAIFAALPRK